MKKNKINRILKELDKIREDMDLEISDEKLLDLAVKIYTVESLDEKGTITEEIEEDEEQEEARPQQTRQEIKIETSNVIPKKCPVCNGKLKKQKIEKVDNTIIQTIACKKKSCPYVKEVVIPI